MVYLTTGFISGETGGRKKFQTSSLKLSITKVCCVQEREREEGVGERWSNGSLVLASLKSTDFVLKDEQNPLKYTDRVYEEFERMSRNANVIVSPLTLDPPSTERSSGTTHPVSVVPREACGVTGKDSVWTLSLDPPQNPSRSAPHSPPNPRILHPEEEWVDTLGLVDGR